MNRNVAFFLLLTLSINCSALFQIRSLTTREGLSQSEVNNIMQDSYGYIWLSTTDGLNRTDGIKTKVMNLTPENWELNQIYGVIREDNLKRLWISVSGDVLIYDLITEKAMLLSQMIPDLPKFDNNNRVFIQMGNDNNVWISDEYKLIELSNNTLPTIKRIVNTNQKRIRSIFVDKRNVEWIALWDGLYKLKNNGIVKISNLQITRIIGDQNGMFAIAKDGIYYMSYLTNYGSWTRISKVIATALTISQNTLWIGTERGLYNIALTEMNLNSESVLTKIDINEQINVKTLTTDNNNQIWIGVDLGGARILNTKKNKFSHYKYPTLKGFDNRIRSLHEDINGNFWIGTRGVGIAFLPKNETDYSKIIFLPFNLVSTIGNSFCSIKNNIYSVFKTFSKIEVSYNGNTPSFKIKNIPLPKEEDILLVCTSDPSGRYVWIGPYSKNLIRYDTEKDKTEIINLTYDKNINPESFVIRNIKFDINGNMWIGTSNGLMIITADNIEKNVFKCKYYNSSGETGALSGNYVEPIFFDTNNNVWIGTFGGSINYSKLDANGLPVSFDKLNNKHEFISGTIRSILEDDNRELWISSNKGLFRFNPQIDQFIAYDINDGLQDYEFGSLTSFKRKNGDIVFGGINGINVFRTNEIQLDTVKPKVIISGFSLFNRAVKVGEKFDNRILLQKALSESPTLHLKYNENYFEVSFEALHFVNPWKNQYKYRLNGFDKDWVYATSANRFAKYTNVPSGKYLFEVMASNSDGVWSEKAAVIEIVIDKPWWLSFWAILFYIVISASFIYIFSKYTIISYRNKFELGIAEIEKNKIKELSELQANFFTNISHEFRTPLSLIVAPVKQLLLMENISSEKQKLYNLINHNASILQRLINQLLDFAKLEKGKLKVTKTSADIVDFSKKTLFIFNELAVQKQINLQFKTPFKYMLFNLDYIMFEHVLYNLLSNALKNTAVGGAIKLSLFKKDDALYIAITDNGKGIPEEYHHTIFERFFQANPYGSGTGLGLSYSKALIELNGGSISFESQPKFGTTFTISFPINDMPIYVENNEMQPIENVNLEMNEPFNIEKELIQGIVNNESAKPFLLIVDDDFSILSYLNEYFSENYEVFLGQNGLEGLQIAQTADIDLIISDVMMPEMSGTELTKKLKTDPQTSHIPIILLTAKNTNEDQIEGYATGADLYCPKPFELKVLDAMIKSLIQNRELLRSEFQSDIENDINKLHINEIDKQFLSKAVECVKKHVDDETFSVLQLSSDLNTTQYLLNKKLKALIGTSAIIFIRSVRLKEAAKLLNETKFTISEIAYRTGFNDQKHFRKCFFEMFGVNPSDYRKN